MGEEGRSQLVGGVGVGSMGTVLLNGVWATPDHVQVAHWVIKVDPHALGVVGITRPVYRGLIISP